MRKFVNIGIKTLAVTSFGKQIELELLFQTNATFLKPKNWQGSGWRIAKGFDFLGYSFEPKGLSIAPKTLANFLERITQLYEQGATVRRIGQYVRNWWRWVRAGVEISVMDDFIFRHSARS